MKARQETDTPLAPHRQKCKSSCYRGCLTFTANQEKEHGEIFYNHLKELAGDTIHIDGGYPVDITDSMIQLLRYAQHNEYEEHDDVYSAFGQKASEEGFLAVANSFNQIAKIEKIHGDRFGMFADLLEAKQALRF